MRNFRIFGANKTNPSGFTEYPLLLLMVYTNCAINNKDRQDTMAEFSWN